MDRRDIWGRGCRVRGRNTPFLGHADILAPSVEDPARSPRNSCLFPRCDREQRSHAGHRCEGARSRQGAGLRPCSDGDREEAFQRCPLLDAHPGPPDEGSRRERARTARLFRGTRWSRRVREAPSRRLLLRSSTARIAALQAGAAEQRRRQKTIHTGALIRRGTQHCLLLYSVS